MLHSTARLTTEDPPGYLERLGVEADPTGRATVTFRHGACLLVPAAHHVDLIANAVDADALAAIEDTVADREDVVWAPLVRPAVARDDAALLALDSTAWTAGSGIPSAHDEGRTSYFGERRKPESHLVAVLGGEVVGFVSLEQKTRFAEGAHVFALWSLVVAEGTRRLGVASALLAAAERVAGEQAATKLSLKVLGSNTAAIRLYERHGYVVEGRAVDEFLIDGAYVDDVSLGKFLRPVSG